MIKPDHEYPGWLFNCLNDNDTIESQIGKYSIPSYETSPKGYEMKGFIRKTKKYKIKRRMVKHILKKGVKNVIYRQNLFIHLKKIKFSHIYF